MNNTPFFIYDDYNGIEVSKAVFCKVSEGSDALKPGWWITKYGSDYKGRLAGLEEADIAELSEHFGIPIQGRAIMDEKDSSAINIMTSNSWTDLQLWQQRHPDLAKGLALFKL